MYFIPQTTKAFLPKMLEQNHGHIVTIASSLGLFTTAGVEVSVAICFLRIEQSKNYSTMVLNGY